MNPWPFIIASYAIGIGGTGALILWSWTGMRRAERDSGQLGRRE